MGRRFAKVRLFSIVELSSLFGPQEEIFSKYITFAFCFLISFSRHQGVSTLEAQVKKGKVTSSSWVLNILGQKTISH